MMPIYHFTLTSYYNFQYKKKQPKKSKRKIRFKSKDPTPKEATSLKKRLEVVTIGTSDT